MDALPSLIVVQKRINGDGDGDHDDGSIRVSELDLVTNASCMHSSRDRTAIEQGSSSSCGSTLQVLILTLGLRLRGVLEHPEHPP